jgi:flagellin
MNVRISSMEVAKNNVADANNLLNIAEGGMTGISDALKSVRELAMQAKNDTLGADERTAIQDSIDSLVSEIDDYVGQAQFNGIALIDGTADLSMQTGPDGGDTTAVTITQDFTSSGLAVDALDVSDNASAGTAIDAIDAALATVDKGRTDIGALQNRFESKSDFLNTAVENLTAAVSRIEDYDYAKGQAEMMKLQTQFQANMSALGQAIQLPQNILSLL